MPKSPTHPLPPGTHVRVVITSTPRRPLEGLAEILAPFGSVPHTYLVRFENEALPVVRRVLPDWQEIPSRAVGPTAPTPAGTTVQMPRAALLNVLGPHRHTRCV